MKYEQNKINIPDDLQKICRELAEVAIKHKLFDLEGKFRSPSGWSGDISFKWTAGRHYEDQNEIVIWSNFQVVTRVKE